MDRYIGLDVHTQSCTMVVMGPSGRRLTSRVVETNGRALVAALQSVAGDRHVCLEEGTQSAWLSELLRPHAVEVVVTLPVRRRGPKDDLRDAWELAEQLRVGTLKTVVYKAPQSIGGLRAAVRGYTMLTQDVVRLKNRLKALYRSRGLVVNKSVYEAAGRDGWVRRLPVSQRKLAEMLGAQLDVVLQARAEAERWVREEAKQWPVVKQLATAPGMGLIRTALVVSIVVTPERFRTARQFWSYCGLGVVTRSSADWVFERGKWVRAQTIQTRGLNRNRHPLLKAVFKGAATTVIQQLGEHPLHRQYELALAAGVKPNLAKLTLARRIAAAVLVMWKRKEVYDPAKQSRHEKV